jgi:AraC family transcriptional regulator
MPQVRRTLYERNGLSAQLSYYSPGARMDLHAHDFHQTSWLLAGEFRERDHRQEQDVCRPSVASKCAGLPHANEYGPHGALILSVNSSNRPAGQSQRHQSRDHHWEASEIGDAATRHALTDLIAADDENSEAAIHDLLAMTPGLSAEAETKPAMPWLERAREQLRDRTEIPNMDRLAQEAGVHRVHLSRSFTRQFGVPPSIYRSRSRLAHACSAILAGEPLADAAAKAGLADQAHLSRLAKREIGLTPSRLRTLLMVG